MWKFDKIKPKKMYSLPAGTYYIGDICYVLSDSMYENIFGGTGYESGLYSSDIGNFLVSGTACGDGIYTGTDGHEYMVDAGVIGIVSAGLCDKETDLGRIYTFSSEVSVKMKDGVFSFNSEGTSLTIDTR